MLDTSCHLGRDGAASSLYDGLSVGFVCRTMTNLEGGMKPLANEDELVSPAGNDEAINCVELGQELIGGGHRPDAVTEGETLLEFVDRSLGRAAA
jgi:hypothetical protein